LSGHDKRSDLLLILLRVAEHIIPFPQFGGGTLISLEEYDRDFG